MRKPILMLAILALASPGAMAKWVEISKTDASTVYADPSVVRKPANLVRVRHLVSLSAPEKIDGTDTQFLSFRLHNEYDCKKTRVRGLQVIFYDKAMGAGKIVFKSDATDNWNPVDLESGIAAMWKFACDKR